MPSIQVSPETFERIQRLAAERGRTPGEVVDEMLAQQPAPLNRLSPEEWGRRWDALLASVRARVPADLSEDEIEANIKAAIDEVRAERRASCR